MKIVRSTIISTHEGNTYHTVYHYHSDDCPFCEIDRLKAELEESKRGAKWEGYKAVCADRDAAIAKIKELTAFLTKEEYRADRLVDKIENLERQLVEKDKQLFEENLQVKRLETANLALRSERDQAVAQLHAELAEARAEVGYTTQAIRR